MLTLPEGRAIITHLSGLRRSLVRISRLWSSAGGHVVQEDSLHPRLAEFLEQRVGKPSTEERLKDIRTVGADRYKEGVPPGYKDAAKSENKYGDLILWFEILEKGKSDERPVILVTDDRKEDWWLKWQGKTVGPYCPKTRTTGFPADSTGFRSR